MSKLKENIIEYLYEENNSMPKLKNIAEKFFVSDAYISKIIKEEFGCTFHELQIYKKSSKYEKPTNVELEFLKNLLQFNDIMLISNKKDLALVYLEENLEKIGINVIEYAIPKDSLVQKYTIFEIIEIENSVSLMLSNNIDDIKIKLSLENTFNEEIVFFKIRAFHVLLHIFSKYLAYE